MCTLTQCTFQQCTLIVPQVWRFYYPLPDTPFQHFVALSRDRCVVCKVRDRRHKDGTDPVWQDMWSVSGQYGLDGRQQLKPLLGSPPYWVRPAGLHSSYCCCRLNQVIYFNIPVLNLLKGLQCVCMWGGGETQ